MEYFDNILCVTYKELLDIMPKGTLNSQLSREKLDVVSRGGGENNPALYAYSSLPEKYKPLIPQHYYKIFFLST